MITLRLDAATPKKFDYAIKSKIEGMKELQSPYSMQKLGEAAFTILATNFIRDISMAAKANRQEFESLYEWTPAGINLAKLFTVSRGSVDGKNLTIFLTPFNKPDKAIPAGSVQLAPQINVSGKITFPTTNTTLAGASDSGKIVTVPKDIVVQIAQDNPSVMLAAFGETWFSNKSQSVMDRSGIFKMLAKEIPLALAQQDAKSAVRRKVAEISRIYSQGRATL